MKNFLMRFFFHSDNICKTWALEFCSIFLLEHRSLAVIKTRLPWISWAFFFHGVVTTFLYVRDNSRISRRCDEGLFGEVLLSSLFFLGALYMCIS